MVTTAPESVTTKIAATANYSLVRFPRLFFHSKYKQSYKHTTTNESVSICFSNMLLLAVVFFFSSSFFVIVVVVAVNVMIPVQFIIF